MASVIYSDNTRTFTDAEKQIRGMLEAIRHEGVKDRYGKNRKKYYEER